MRTNVAVKAITHEGGPAVSFSAERQLKRAVMACLLWEDSFYEDGKEIAERIASLVGQVSPEFAAACAFHARTDMKLRHVPLLIVREMARLPEHKALVGKLLPDVIQRADEMAEFLSIYWKDKRQPVSAQVKKGLARAFAKFDEYHFAKYDRDGAVKLRDALFVCHARPTDEALYRRIVDRRLAVPDTWEVALSAGEDKKTAFERLMSENKLGALAFIRNLRNMAQAGVEKSTVSAYAENLKVERVLPFRFITAARMVPMWEDLLEPLMMKCLAGQEKLAGRTALLVDVSGSMDHPLSARSETTRMDAGFGLGVLLREICEDVRIFTFSQQVVEIPGRRGFALRDAMKASQPNAGTYLGEAVHAINAQVPYDRLIVITDEQAHDRVGAPKGPGYMVNVASYRNGVGYGKWMRIDGWSEAIIRYIQESEAETV